MERVLRHLAGLNRRLVISAGLFVIFMIAAVVVGAQGTTMQDDTLFFLLVPGVASFVVLPRSARVSPWPTAEDDDEMERLEMLRDQLSVVERRAMYMRFFYFGIGFLLLVVLPRIGI